MLLLADCLHVISVYCIDYIASRILFKKKYYEQVFIFCGKKRFYSLPSLETRITFAFSGLDDFPILILLKRLPYTDGPHLGKGFNEQDQRPLQSDL